MRHLSDIVYNQHPVTLPPSCSVKEACEAMRDRNAGAVVVARNGRLVGIFTGRDAVGRVVAEGKDPAETTLSEVMTREPQTMAPGTSALEALRLMWDGGFRHIPVVEKGVLLGVVSRGDFQACEEERLEQERELWEHMR